MQVAVGIGWIGIDKFAPDQVGEAVERVRGRPRQGLGDRDVSVVVRKAVADTPTAVREGHPGPGIGIAGTSATEQRTDDRAEERSGEGTEKNANAWNDKAA